MPISKFPNESKAAQPAEKSNMIPQPQNSHPIMRVLTKWENHFGTVRGTITKNDSSAPCSKAASDKMRG